MAAFNASLSDITGIYYVATPDWSATIAANSFWSTTAALLPADALPAAQSIGNTPHGGVSLLASIHQSFAEDWFNKIHVIPVTLALGNILSNQARVIEIYNSYLVDRSWTGFVNNAGSGIAATNLPGLPQTLFSFSSFFLGVTISTVGPPVIAGTLDLVFDVRTQLVTVTGRRINLLPNVPEDPVVETLKFNTGILEAWDGTEQRIKYYTNPQQLFTLRLKAEDDPASAQLRALLYDWLPRVWGLPMWHEARQAAAAIPAGTLTVTISTLYADFRVGGLTLIWQSEFLLEALQVASFNATSVTFTTVTLNTYTAGAFIMPVRTAYADPRASISRFPAGPDETVLSFLVNDNIPLGSEAAFPAYQGRPILSDANYMPSETLREGWLRRTERLESDSGNVLQLPVTDRSRYSTTKGFYPKTMQGVWEIRQLAHALGGSLKTFFLPSFRADLVLTQTIGDGSTAFVVTNIGFATYYGLTSSFRDVRIIRTNGTTILRRIVGAVNSSAVEETISVDSPIVIGSSITVAQVFRIELVAQVRIRDDQVTLIHHRPGDTEIEMDVITVKE